MIFNAKVIELNENNDIYLEMVVLLISNRVNLNNARFTDDFINDVVANKDFYIGLPLVADRQKLESKQYSKLKHLLDKRKNEFGTEQVGSYVDFFASEHDNTLCLFGIARVSKRFTKTCDAIIELYNKGELNFSIECLVGEYNYLDDGVREIDVNEQNKLFGDCIVSNPADVLSTATMMIAEALNKDLGGENLLFDKFFEKSNCIETSEVDIHQVKQQLFDLLYEKTEFLDSYCVEIGYGYMIISDCCEAELTKVEYTVLNDVATIIDIYPVNKSYVRIANTSDSEDSTENEMSNENSNDQSSEQSENTENSENIEDSACGKKKGMEDESSEQSESNENSETSNETSNEDSACKKQGMENETSEIDSLKSELSELKSQIVNLSESLIAKDTEISELIKCKDELDAIKLEKSNLELSEKKNSLKEKYSKLLPDEIMTKVEVAEAIENLDESFLQTEVVNLALSSLNKQNGKKPEKVKYISSINDEIVLDSSLITKYITIR